MRPGIGLVAPPKPEPPPEVIGPREPTDDVDGGPAPMPPDMDDIPPPIGDRLNDARFELIEEFPRD
jgi:hypothetical protein